MQAIYLSKDELRLVSAALKEERTRCIADFDQAQSQKDLVSQRRAVRIAREAKQLHVLISRLDELDRSCG